MKKIIIILLPVLLVACNQQPSNTTATPGPTDGPSKDVLDGTYFPPELVKR